MSYSCIMTMGKTKPVLTVCKNRLVPVVGFNFGLCITHIKIPIKILLLVSKKNDKRKERKKPKK